VGEKAKVNHINNYYSWNYTCKWY